MPLLSRITEEVPDFKLLYLFNYVYTERLNAQFGEQRFRVFRDCFKTTNAIPLLNQMFKFKSAAQDELRKIY